MATLKNTTIDDTGFFRPPVGTTAQRPGTPAAGMMRYNTETNRVEVYTNEWQRIDLESTSLPVANPALWFDNADLTAYGNGSAVTLWVNKGTLGSGYDFVQNQSISNSTGTPGFPFRSTINSQACITFDGGSNRVLYFRNFQNSPPNGVFFFDGSTGGSISPLDRTIFYVYYSTSGNITAFGSNSGNYSIAGYSLAFGNIGMWNGNYTIIESNDGFPIGSSTGVTYDSGVIAQAGHRQNPSVTNTVNVWKNRSSGFSNFSYSNVSAQVNPVGTGYSRSGTISNGSIFEIIVYDRALNDSEISTIRTYLGSKYGGTANS